MSHNITRQQLVETIEAEYAQLDQISQHTPRGQDGLTPSEWMKRIKANHPESDGYLIAFSLAAKSINVQQALHYLVSVGKKDSYLYSFLASKLAN